MTTSITTAVALSAALLCASLTTTVNAQNRIDTQRPDAPELAAYGDYDIGTQSITLTNPDQVNILALDPSAVQPTELPTYNRELPIQLWYPALPGATGSKALNVFLRDGTTQIELFGNATESAAPVVNDGPFPLVIVSHGYPGNRFLLSHLAENIASKGYIVASIDHTDSTYRTQAAFGSTLRNRSLDQIFVLNELARLNNDSENFLSGLMDTDNSAIVGYSMGGYGAIISAGGGVTAESVNFSYSPPFGTLGIHESGSDTHNALPDPRIKTAIALAPWGRNSGFFDAESNAGIQIPMLFVAGSDDDVSLYEDGIRAIWNEAINVDRALLTFENANHNAAAPFPAPAESYLISPSLDRPTFDHYSDAVWDTARMNNIAQHFTTAWLDRYLKDNTSIDAFLNLIPNSNDGVYSANDDGTFTDQHTYWAGFQDRSAKGMMFEWLHGGDSGSDSVGDSRQDK